MTDRFDTALRGSLTALADSAPAEAAVRAALAGRRRPRTGLVAAAALAAVVVVAVPVLRAGDEGGAPPARFPVAAVTVTPVPLTPTWLPPGLTEQSRSTGPEGVFRAWHAGPPARDGRYDLVLAAWTSTAEIANTGDPVDLGALGSGYYFDQEGVRGLHWKRGETTYQLDAPFRVTDRDTLVRIARGLREQPAPPLRTALEFGDGARVSQAVVGVRASASGAPVLFTGGTILLDVSATVTAELTPDRPDTADPDARTSVLNRPATVHTYRPGDHALPTETLVVPLDGRWLVVSLHAPSPDLDRVPALVDIAEHLRIGPDQPNPWLGH